MSETTPKLGVKYLKIYPTIIAQAVREGAARCCEIMKNSSKFWLHSNLKKQLFFLIR